MGDGNSEIIESIFAGRDVDGALKIELVDIVAGDAFGNELTRFTWTQRERLPGAEIDLLLSGDVRPLRAALALLTCSG